MAMKEKFGNKFIKIPSKFRNPISDIEFQFFGNACFFKGIHFRDTIFLFFWKGRGRVRIFKNDFFLKLHLSFDMLSSLRAERIPSLISLCFP
jgi:hypothetical protein